jgi:hypothetical protein
LLLAALGRRGLGRAVAALRLDHAELAALFERLSSPLVDTRATVPEEEPAAREAAAGGAAPAPGRGAVASAVIWGDVPLAEPAALELVARRFGWSVERLERAGVEDTASDTRAIEAVAAASGDGAPVVLIAESFESPTREARAFVTRLRAALGATRPVVVGLVDDAAGEPRPPAADDLRIWQRHLAALGDTSLRVEPLVEDP